MKKIEAVIRHYKLEDVKNLLTGAGFNGITVSEVRGFGRQRGRPQAEGYSVDFLPKVHLMLLCHDADAAKAVETIAAGAVTGKVGDGVVWVTNVESYVRIRTGEVALDPI